LLLKETGVRIGEARRLRWEDIDFTRKMITFNNPEKSGNLRIKKASDWLIATLNRVL
jgi:integrase